MDYRRRTVAALRGMVLAVPSRAAGAGFAGAGRAFSVRAGACPGVLAAAAGAVLLHSLSHGEHARAGIAAAPVVRSAPVRPSAVYGTVAAQRHSCAGGQPQPVGDRGIGKLAHCLCRPGVLLHGADSGVGAGGARETRSATAAVANRRRG